jgi:hypothetical protein
MAKKKTDWCCWGGEDKGFPTFAVIVLLLGLLWLFSELGVLTFEIPWWPVIITLFGLGMLIDHYKKKK